MKNKILLFLFFMPMLVFSQVEEKIAFDSEIRFGTVFADNYNSVYVVKNNIIIEKHDAKGKLLSSYSSKRNGKIAFVDFSNPLRILVYYRVNQQIVFLDNTLSEMGNYILKSDYTRINSVANGSDNSILYFDENRQILVRENIESGIRNESINLSQRMGKRISSTQIIDNNQRIFLLDTLNGLLEFDFYCSFLKNHGNFGFEKVQIQGDLLIGRKGNQLEFIDLKNKKSMKVETLDASAVLDSYYSGDRIYFLTKKAVFLQAVID